MYNHTYIHTYIHPGGSATAVLDGGIGVTSYGDGLEGRASLGRRPRWISPPGREGSGQDHAHQVRVATMKRSRLLMKRETLVRRPTLL